MLLIDESALETLNTTGFHMKKLKNVDYFL